MVEGLHGDFEALTLLAEAARVVVLLCLLHFAFWYTLHAMENRDISRAARQYETWNTINHGGPERRMTSGAAPAAKSIVSGG